MINDILQEPKSINSVKNALAIDDEAEVHIRSGLSVLVQGVLEIFRYLQLPYPWSAACSSTY